MINQDIQGKIDTINRLILEVRAFKDEHPTYTTGYYPEHRGSLLNAYREGDISFEKCVELMAKAKYPAAKEGENVQEGRS